MGSIFQNIRYSARQLSARPGFTALAVLVLALGIGANTAMFSLVNAFLFKPLVIHEPERIVGLYSKDTKKPDTYRSFSYPEMADIRRANSVFTELAAHNMALVGLTEGDSTRRIMADLVTSNFFATFGVPLRVGRTFSPEEERPGSAIPVAILSHAFWVKRGADPAPLGKRLRINGRDLAIIGVAPQGFSGTLALVSPEIYLPLGMYEAVVNDFGGERRPLAARDNRALIAIGRLRGGLDLQAADVQLAATSAHLEKPLPDDRDQALVVRPLSRLSVSTNPTDDTELRAPSLLLLSLAGVVLLIASLNVANMVLARGNSRRKEMAIRLALGAGRRDIVAQGLTEGLMLALLGGIAGSFVAAAGTTLLIRSLGAIAPIQIAFDATPDVRVLAATFGFCLVSTLLFSLGPSRALARPNVATQLKADEQTGSQGRERRLLSRRNLLVIGQLSLSLALLAAAGLFVRSSLAALSLQPGFRMERGAVVEIDPGLAGYDPERSAQVTRAMVERLRALPGVESASLAATVPFGMTSLGRTVQRASDPVSDLRDPAKRDRRVGTSFNIVGADYFATLGIPILRGRPFREAETLAGQKTAGVAVIDQLAAEKLWPKGENPIGQRLRMVQGDGNAQTREVEVVGVVANICDHIVGGKPQPHLYVPFGPEAQSNMHIHLALQPGSARSPEAEGLVLEAVRREIRAVDSRVPVLAFRTLQDHLEASMDLWIVRTAARIFGLFGLVAVLLAAVGLYGVRAYTVAQRTREIGIRMAIGASQSDALGLILREGLVITAVGSAVGLLLALGLGRVLSGMLYQVSGVDPAVFVTTPVLLGLVSLLACWVPAQRAARIQPMVALHGE
ncbi:MAG TPA: ABC transporter permease [Thermoanaerobaculia bacterium]|nr:ABC transporter permease [Thermoanaerobaculia bacterium]